MVDAARTPTRATELSPLWAPSSVAVVGASERAGHGANAVRNLLENKFAGPIYPVNPKYTSIGGLTCYPSLEALPAPAECVVIAVRDELAVSVLDDAGRRGSKAAVIFTSGFAEAGDAGRRLQVRLRDVARSHGMAVCGPNCMGLVNFAAAVPLYVAPLPPLRRRRSGDTAIIAQSGSVSSLFLYHTDRIACSYVISSGNEAVTDSADYLRAIMRDGRTRIVGLFVESISRPAELLDAVRAASNTGIAVAICKTGRSARGVRATMAHTGALTQPYEVVTAAFRQAGALVVDDLDEMVETLAALSGVVRRRRAPNAPPPALAVATASGGQNALILDLADEIGIDFAPLRETTRQQLAAELPDFATAENPLDVTGALLFSPEQYGRVLSTLANDDNIDALVNVQELPRPTLKPADRRRFWHTLETFARVAAATGKPAFFVTPIAMPSDTSVTRLFKPAGVTILKGLRPALRALANVRRWTAWQHAFHQAAANGDQTPAVHGAAGGAGALPDAEVLHERAALDWLKNAGLPVVGYAQAADPDQAVAAAARLGYPVALKIDVAGVLHKSDIGGVEIALADDSDVRRAFRDIRQRVGDRAPGIDVSGYLVQRMAPPGIEVIVGCRKDPDFGLVVLLGVGGTLVDVLRRAAIRRPPLRGFDVDEMLNELPELKRLLAGVRGAGPADVTALKHLIVRVSDLCMQHERVLQEMDLNPVIVSPAGVYIVDALIVSGTAPAVRSSGHPSQTPADGGAPHGYLG